MSALATESIAANRPKEAGVAAKATFLPDIFELGFDLGHNDNWFSLATINRLASLTPNDRRFAVNQAREFRQLNGTGEQVLHKRVLETCLSDLAREEVAEDEQMVKKIAKAIRERAGLTLRQSTEILLSQTNVSINARLTILSEVRDFLSSTTLSEPAGIELADLNQKIIAYCLSCLKQTEVTQNETLMQRVIGVLRTRSGLTLLQSGELLMSQSDVGPKAALAIFKNVEAKTMEGKDLGQQATFRLIMKSVTEALKAIDAPSLEGFNFRSTSFAEVEEFLVTLEGKDEVLSDDELLKKALWNFYEPRVKEKILKLEFNLAGTQFQDRDAYQTILKYLSPGSISHLVGEGSEASTEDSQRLTTYIRSMTPTHVNSTPSARGTYQGRQHEYQSIAANARAMTIFDAETTAKREQEPALEKLPAPQSETITSDVVILNLLSDETTQQQVLFEPAQLEAVGD